MSTIRGEYSILELHPPGQDGVPVGVLLLDPAANRLYVKLVERWPESVEREDREVLAAFAAELEARAENEPAGALLEAFEESFSHLLRLTERESVFVQKPERELEALFARHVSAHTAPRREAAEVVPFRTHLPYYPMRIAAGLFDGDSEVEAAGWVPVPGGVRAEESLFVARISGKSMEPRIPDGSYCLFRLNPRGSREGKLVLVQKYGSSETGGAFAIKRYHSEKAPQRPAGEDDFDAGEWRHARVRLISLNPNYPSWDLVEGECRVLAELVRILDLDEIPDELTAGE